MSAPHQECPRFEKCSVSNCPLHSSYPGLSTDPEDKERSCTMEKQVRLRIAAKYPGVLKFGGLKQREYSSKLVYENLNPAEKEEIANRLKKTQFASVSQKQTPQVIEQEG